MKISQDQDINQTELIKDKQDKSKGSFLFYFRFILLVIAIGVNSTTLTSVPFIFNQSRLDCIDSKTSKPYECTYQEACELGNYKVSDDQPYPQLFSITRDLDLFCDRAIFDVYIQTSGKIGRVTAYILLVLIPIKKEIKEIFLNIQFFVLASVMLFLIWFQTIEMFIIAFFVWYFCFTFIFGIFYIFIEEQLPLAYQNYAIGFTNITWTTSMIMYVIYAYYFGSWQNTLVHFIAIPCLIISSFNTSMYFFNPSSQSLQENATHQLIEQQNFDESNIQIQQAENVNQEDKQKLHESQPLQTQSSKQIELYTEEQSGNLQDENQQGQDKNLQNVNERQVNNSILYKFFPFMFYDDIRHNFYIWTICRVTQGVIYNFPFYYLDQIQGDLFVNSIIVTFAEVLASFLASFILVWFKDSLKTASTVIQFLTAFVFFVYMFIFDSSKDQKKSQSYLEITIALMPFILSKISYIAWVVLMAYQKQVIPINFQQQQLSITNQLNALAVTFVPTYRYFCINSGISPFTGLGILGLVGTIASQFFIEIKEEDYSFQQVKENEIDQQIQDKTK
ncbi:hypothetical protein ABPG74_007047 [Tetrahymena malaccensis]